jgi:aminoglycoside 3-N-acetyltransferase
MLNSESDVGYVTEELRKRWWRVRTVDPLFSYVVMGNGLSEENFSPRDYESFGNNSLIAELYENNAMICSVASPWTKTFTELHFIERMLDVKYRQNKTFYGKTIDAGGDIHETSVTFFCRNYDYKLRSGTAQLAEDLIKDEVMKTINVEDKLQIKGVYFKDLYEYVKRKIKDDYFYLCEEVPNGGK